MVNVPMPLLDYLMCRIRPHMLSDLHCLNELEHRRLIRVLEELKPDCGTLEEWNDALAYLVQAPPEQSALEARRRLISLLKTR